jgi:hypothetical protein
MDLNEECVSKITSVLEVDLNAVATTELYLVPAGKAMAPDHYKIRDLSASAGNAVVTFGASDAKTDFVAAQTLSNLDAAGKAAKIQPVPNATPVAIIEYAAGTICVIDVTTAAGSACTASIDLFGTLRDV